MQRSYSYPSRPRPSRIPTCGGRGHRPLGQRVPASSAVSATTCGSKAQSWALASARAPPFWFQDWGRRPMEEPPNPLARATPSRTKLIAKRFEIPRPRPYQESVALPRKDSGAPPGLPEATGTEVEEEEPFQQGQQSRQPTAVRLARPRGPAPLARPHKPRLARSPAPSWPGRGPRPAHRQARPRPAHLLVGARVLGPKPEKL